jgi:hypothetical protein
VKFPSNWTPAELYDFDWQALKTTAAPIDMHSYV